MIIRGRNYPPPQNTCIVSNYLLILSQIQVPGLFFPLSESTRALRLPENETKLQTTTHCNTRLSLFQNCTKYKHKDIITQK